MMRTSALQISRLGASCLLAACALGCSGEDVEGPGPNAPRVNPDGTPISSGNNPTAPRVANYDRAAGMSIGQGAGGPGSEEDALPSEIAPSAGGSGNPPDDGEIEIPVFEGPDETPPPCSGCVELNMDVNDINQRDDFVFNAGASGVTRVVWSLIIPFNSDQLFVQPFVDSSYGTYTDLDANAFAVGTPFQLVHQFTGTANTVGLAIGSAGAWTGDMRMAVYVDSVTLEGAATGSRTFDVSAEGFAARSASRNPGLVHHP